MSPVAVVVLSCDKYADLWDGFFQHFWRAWPDCPYPVYLFSNTVVARDERVVTVLSGDEVSWSDSVKRCLLQVDADHVLLIQDDFYLRGRVKSAVIGLAWEVMCAEDAFYCRLVPDGARWLRGRVGVEGGFRWISPLSAFRISNQASIWRRESLLGFLVDGESPWQFEVLGSERTRSSRFGFLSTSQPALDYDGHGVLVRGRWTRRALREFYGGRPAGLLRRESLTRFEELVLGLRTVEFGLVMSACQRCVRAWNLRRVSQ